MNATPMPDRFVLIADDYALTPAVSAGILRLLEAGRISGTGAMTNMPGWHEAAPALAAFAGAAELGVHLNLTCGPALVAAPALAPGGAFRPLPALLPRALAGALPEAAVAAELEAQLAAFEARMGRAPDFIDGHQHVHALPGVRRVLARVLARRYPGPERPWLRDPADRPGAIRRRRRHAAKAALLAGLAAPFASGMRARGFRLNAGFSGFSAFDPHADYGADFARYLLTPGPAHLVMCHPGEVDEALRALDPATDSRKVELAFFLSPRFDDLCAAAGLRPGRFPPR